MEALFIKLLNMSITASWLILAVIVLRMLLKKAPKWVMCVLWAFVAVRLLCPISIENILSLIPSAEVIPEDIMYAQNPEITTGISSVNNLVNPVIQQAFAPKYPVVSINPLQIWTWVAAKVWIIGMAVLLIYAIVSYFRLRKRVSTAVRLEENMYQSEYVTSPFILGIIRPRIYLPMKMEEQQMDYVIAHEKAHLVRKDHWWKPLGYLLLTVYWFNPLCWIAYWLLCKDIELACDEKVIKDFDLHNKKRYSEILVSCSVSHRSIAACPLAFGETDVKNRIKNVLHYKKPAFWISIAAVMICIVIAVCFLTDPKSEKEVSDLKEDTIYHVEEITYESPSYSFTYTPEGYQITKENHLMSLGELTGNSEGWTDLGQLKSITLTKENFDSLFRDEATSALNGGWHTMQTKSAKIIRENNAKAWHLTYEYQTEDSSIKIIYYVLVQKNGEIYLAYGYDREQEADHFRWMFELAKEVPVESVPEGYTLEDALADDLVVMANGDVMNGQEKWNDFYETTRKGEAASIKVAYYYTLMDKSRYEESYYESIKDNYPCLYVMSLNYDGSRYTIVNFEEGKMYMSTYAYLIRYEGKAAATATYSDYVRYVLVNDSTVTWDEIEWGMLSSQLGDYIEHFAVYTDLIF